MRAQIVKTPIPRAVSGQAERIMGFLTDPSNKEWLPPIDDPDSKATHEPECFIASPEDLRRPAVARGNCVLITECIADVINNRTGLNHNLLDHEEAHCTFPEGSPCSNHVANLLTTASGEQYIIDFSYAQFDEKKPFPYIATVSQWESDLAHWARKSAEQKN